MNLPSILRQLATTAALVVVFYLALRLTIRMHYPEDETAPIDTMNTNSTLVDTAPQIVLYEIDRLRRPADRRLIVVGSSNAQMALLPVNLRRELPGWEIHNLAIPTSNVHEVRQVIDLVLGSSDPDTLARTIIVIGSYYGLFAPGNPLWSRERDPRSPLSVEMLRYGLYRPGAGDSPVPILGYGQVGLTKDLYRVVLGADALSRAVGRLEDLVIAGKAPDLGVLAATRRHPYHFLEAPSDEANKRKENDKRAHQIGTAGTIPDEQFLVLEDTVRRVAAAGARVVITELPAPTWNRLAHFQFYRKKKQSFVRGLSRIPGVGYLDLYDAVPDDRMGDSSHPLREGSRLYTEKFVRALRELPGFLPDDAPRN
jgi:hypothetical protein